MTGLHESTLALSVYTALARHGSGDRRQLLAVLQSAWMPGVEIEEIDAGIGYLLTRKLVTEADGVIAPAQMENGAAATVIRNPTQHTELVRVGSK